MAITITSTIPGLLDTFASDLRKKSDLSGVGVYSGPMAENAPELDTIIFFGAEVDNLRTGLGASSEFEEYEISGYVHARRAGAGETAIKTARDRAFTLFAVLAEYVADDTSHIDTRLTLDRVKQGVDPEGRWTALEFTVHVRAVINPT